MGGKPSKGTSADRRLNANTGRGDKQPNSMSGHPQMPTEKPYGTHPTAKTTWRDDMLVKATGSTPKK